MKKTLSNIEAVEELLQDQNASWTRAGAYALIDYLEELESDSGEIIEFDRVGLRCDFSEYDSPQAWGEDYFGGWNKLIEHFGSDYFGPLEGETSEEYAERFDEAIREYIRDHGTLIEFDGGIIVSSF